MNAEQKTVLCVEDNELELIARKKLFEAAGFRVLEARSKESAISAFQSNPIDAVVLDYWLVTGLGGNGTAVAEAIKSIRPSTPVLMLSGYGPLPGESAIVDAWISKGGTDPVDLIRKVERLIEQRRRPETHKG